MPIQYDSINIQWAVTRDEAISAEFGADSIHSINIQWGVTLCQVFCPIGGTNVQKTTCFLTFWADSVAEVRRERVGFRGFPV